MWNFEPSCGIVEFSTGGDIGLKYGICVIFYVSQKRANFETI